MIQRSGRVFQLSRPLLPLFHARDLELHHHHHQFLYRQQNLEDEQSENNNMNRSLKRDRGEGEELVPATKEGEMTKRPRGRPAGSKNKPKPPIIIALDSSNAFRAHVMEVVDGCDIQESVSTLATRRHRGFAHPPPNFTLRHYQFLPLPPLSAAHFNFKLFAQKMKIFNWVHRKFNYKDGIGGNENKNAKDTDKDILLEDIALGDMLHGWKGGILTIGTFGFNRINIEEKEYLYRDEEEEDESDVTDESEEDDDEDQESNPLMHAAYAHEFEGSTCDNAAKDTIDSDCDMKNMKKERITLADLFYADSDEQEKYKKSKGKLLEPEYNKKLSAPEANYKRRLTFAKKLVPRVGEDSRPIKKLHQLMTRMLKRKIHPDIGVNINKDNHQNTKPKVAFEDGKIYESISLLQSQDVNM
ncbi:unnamed protein product [Fraxinus pennsylvanica]|uniref:Protein TILLER ANGLE CONTROL 1 n=1 Tax=Fraxinus pennsylvanica TaxID=56036 RepID=A0AAD1Z839_9LAMI|nr:unnamed protein product [Fraxinus pennsylvanica]